MINFLNFHILLESSFSFSNFRPIWRPQMLTFQELKIPLPLSHKCKARYVQKRTSVMATSINNMCRHVMSTSIKEERWYRKLISDFFQIFWAKYQLHVYITVQKMKFSMKDFFTFTEEIVNGNFYFLCSVTQLIDFTSSSDFYN